jgi:hypothetical protein
VIRRRLCPGAPAAFTALNSDILTLLHGHATCHHYVAGEKRGSIEEWITATQEEEALAIGDTQEGAHPVVVE